MSEQETIDDIIALLTQCRDLLTAINERTKPKEEPTGPKMSFKELAKAYLDYSRSKVKPSTLCTYENLLLVSPFATSLANRDVSELSRSAVQLWIDSFDAQVPRGGAHRHQQGRHHLQDHLEALTMADTHETTSDIIAEMRIFKCRDLETGKLEPCNAIANYFADRLDRAWMKTEIEIANLRKENAKIRDALVTIQNCDINKEEDCITLYSVCEAALATTSSQTK